MSFFESELCDTVLSLQEYEAPAIDDGKLEVVAIFGSVQMAMSRIINLHHHRIAQVGTHWVGTRKGLSPVATTQDVGCFQEFTRYKNGRVEGVGYLVGSKVLAEVRNRGGRDQRSKKSIANICFLPGII